MSDRATNASLHADSNDFRNSLSKLQEAAEDLANTRTIDHEARADASSIAHQLARALEHAGHAAAAAKAHEVTATLDHAGLPQPERFQEQVLALSSLLQH